MASQAGEVASSAAADKEQMVCEAAAAYDVNYGVHQGKYKPQLVVEAVLVDPQNRGGARLGRRNGVLAECQVVHTSYGLGIVTPPGARHTARGCRLAS